MVCFAISSSPVQPSWVPVPEGFAGAAACILGCRLVLNLRDAYYLPFTEEFETGPGVVHSALRFRHVRSSRCAIATNLDEEITVTSA